LLVQALLLAGLAWSGLARPLTLLGVAVVIGCINAVDLPARLAFVVEMVEREDLPNARSAKFDVVQRRPCCGGHF